jgi:hypothetical protein
VTDEQRAFGPTLLDRSVAGDMVAMAVRIQNGRWHEFPPVEDLDNAMRFEPGVDHEAVLTAGQPGDVSIFLEKL